MKKQRFNVFLSLQTCKQCIQPIKREDPAFGSLPWSTISFNRKAHSSDRPISSRDNNCTQSQPTRTEAAR
uniref:Uncharacterized protein n=1 Tax=Arundo donax TaxID=35708 RepID=A0A0A9F8K3_ARUDO